MEHKASFISLKAKIILISPNRQYLILDLPTEMTEIFYIAFLHSHHYVMFSVSHQEPVTKA